LVLAAREECSIYMSHPFCVFLTEFYVYCNYEFSEKFINISHKITFKYFRQQHNRIISFAVSDHYTSTKLLRLKKFTAVYYNNGIYYSVTVK